MLCRRMAVLAICCAAGVCAVITISPVSAFRDDVPARDFDRSAKQLESVFAPIVGKAFGPSKDPRRDPRVHEMIAEHEATYGDRIIHRIDSFSSNLTLSQQAYLLACAEMVTPSIHRAYGRCVERAEDEYVCDLLARARFRRLEAKISWSRLKSAITSESRNTAIIAAMVFDDLVSYPMGAGTEEDAVDEELPKLVFRVNPEVREMLFTTVVKRRYAYRRWILEDAALTIVRRAIESCSSNAWTSDDLGVDGPAFCYLCALYGVDPLEGSEAWHRIHRLRAIRLAVPQRSASN